MFSAAENAWYSRGTDGNVRTGSMDVLERKISAHERAERIEAATGNQDIDWGERCHDAYDNYGTIRPHHASWNTTRPPLTVDTMQSEAWDDHKIKASRHELAKAKRRERIEVEMTRDPLAVSERERLERELMIVRVPPRAEELKEAVDRWRSAKANSEKLKVEASKRKHDGQSANEAQLATKRRTGVGTDRERQLWGEMMVASQEGSVSASSSAVGGAGSNGETKTKTPWARQPRKDPKALRYA